MRTRNSNLVINLARKLLFCLIAGSQGLVMILGEELVPQQCKRSVGRFGRVEGGQDELGDDSAMTTFKSSQNPTDLI
jgi:hypothetical protein